jgi:hypothetical protein
MGLDLEIGVIARLKQDDPEAAELYRRRLTKVYALMKLEGEPTWVEPEEPLNIQMRPHVAGFPYSFLHCLRRAYAYAVERPGEPLPPLGGDGDLSQADEHLVDAASAMLDSHLLNHSDCEGLYVPVDFPEPLFDTASLGVLGGGVGSSQGLMRELVRVAPLLGIQLGEGGALSDEEATRVYETSIDEGSPYWQEWIVWLALYELARASIAHQSAIWFN